MKLPKTDPKILLWVGGAMLVLGFVCHSYDFPSDFFNLVLNFLSYAFQVVGMVLTTLGSFSIVKLRLDKEKPNNKDNLFVTKDHPDEKID